MKAAVLYGNQDIRYVDWEEPRIKPGTVKVRVKACGICGSDVPRVINHGAHYYPIILGHEFSGIITETADDVEGMAAGDHVAGVPLLPCMKCRDCLQGNYSQCRYYSFIGSREQGAFADYVVLPAKNVISVAKSIAFEQAALFEPCTVALHGIKRTNYKGGGSVAILGGGTIGLFTLQWAKLYGAAKVVVFGRSREHLKTAQMLGADYVISTIDKDYFEQAMELTQGGGFEYVFETAGSVATMKMAFDLAAKHAEVCFIGTPTEEMCFLPEQWEQMNRKEFRLTGSWMSCTAPFPGNEWSETAYFSSEKKIQFVPELFHKIYQMREAASAFQEFYHRERVKGRILLVNE